VDRVRIIRRSIRCFVFGWIAAVPLLGIGAAFLALRLRRQVAAETGGPARLTGVNECSFVAFVAAFMVLCYGRQPGLLLALGFLLSALEAYLLFRQYVRTEPVEWNPARQLAWWGAGLAYAGLNFSATLILLGIESILPA
jgi:hypothetical protein